MNFELKLTESNLKRRDDSALDLDDLDESLNALEIAIIKFQDIFWGSNWSLIFGERVFTMWVEDIPYLWDDLPEQIAGIETTNNIVSIANLSQGTEMLILIKAHTTSELEVAIISCEDVDNFYDYYNSAQMTYDNKFPKQIINRNLFIDEWRSFIDTVLNLLIVNGLIDTNDQSIKEFKQKIPE